MKRLTIHLKYVKPVMKDRLTVVEDKGKKTKVIKPKSIINNTLSIEVKNDDDIELALANHIGNIKKYYITNVL